MTRIYPSQTAEYRRRYRQHLDRRAKAKEYGRKYYQENREKKLSYNKEHQDRIKQHQDKYYKKYKDNIQFRLVHVLRSSLYKALKRQGIKPEIDVLSLLGGTIPEFISHLEILFQAGMSWNNYGKWQIDHIKPISLFDLSIRTEIDRCYHYSNLQPLWTKENILKRNKYVN